MVTNACIKREFLDGADLSWLPTTMDGNVRDQRYIKAAAACIFSSHSAGEVKAGLIQAFR